MNKSELVQSLSESQNLPIDVAIATVDSFFDAIRETLVEGNRIEIRGFGSFKTKRYKGYTGRNPKSGETVTVAPKRLAIFRPGKELKEVLNQ